MEATKSRNELVRILSNVYRDSSADELGPITYLIQGRLAPFFESVEIGLGERLLITAIALAYRAPKDEVTKLNRETGDLGITPQRLSPRPTVEWPSVIGSLARISESSPAGVAGMHPEDVKRS